MGQFPFMLPFSDVFSLAGTQHFNEFFRVYHAHSPGCQMMLGRTSSPWQNNTQGSTSPGSPAMAEQGMQGALRSGVSAPEAPSPP